MTESLTDPSASQFMVILNRRQMDALSELLFELVRASHEHKQADPNIDRPTAAKMHQLLAAFEQQV